MKVYTSITGANEAAALAAIDTIEVQIGREWYYLEKYAALFEKLRFALISATSFGFWAEAPFIIQGLRATIGGALTTLNIDYLDSNKIEAYSDVVKDTTVKEWKKDCGYLIPFSAGAVLDMIPDSMIVPIEGTSDGVFVPTHYAYWSKEVMSVRGGASFTAAAEFRLVGQGVADWSKGKADSQVALGVSVISTMKGAR